MNLISDPAVPAVSTNGHPPVASLASASTSASTGAIDVTKNPATNSNTTKNSKPRGPRKTPLHQIYTLPAPIRTFPLPTFYPSNPLSLFHVLYAWLSQTLLSPSPREPRLVHKGEWHFETRSVHITDQTAIRALWEQGFFGKGIYSRSEPNWLRREQTRRGESKGHVAENFTAQRRRERNQMKWERARKEQEAIERTRNQEAWVAPVGPLELLALPNSALDLPLATSQQSQVILDGAEQDAIPQINEPRLQKQQPELLSPIPRRKSVRFSPKIEATTFNFSDPPSPGGHAPEQLSLEQQLLNGNTAPPAVSTEVPLEPSTRQQVTLSSPQPDDALSLEDIKDIEYLQLSPEEAFYLTFSLGVLIITDSNTSQPISTAQLFQLFRDNSYAKSSPFNPLSTRASTIMSVGIRPDDPFLLQYATYHHFRSLGWVVRPGIKFGVDWLLYHRGPVFSHAEFAVLVLPAYTHSWWKTGAGRQYADRQGALEPRRSWHWLHCANRVQAKALKTLVLVYVDVPPPRSAVAESGDHDGKGAEGAQGEESIANVLGRYKIREFMVKRWLSNRNRD